MTLWVRSLAILLLAAFTVGTVMHTVGAAAMSVKMTLAAVNGGDMGDCQECPDGNDDMPACDNLCVSPILAVVPSSQSGLPDAKTTTASLILQSVTGRTGPPDPYPPRSIILS